MTVHVEIAVARDPSDSQRSTYVSVAKDIDVIVNVESLCCDRTVIPVCDLDISIRRPCHVTGRTIEVKLKTFSVYATIGYNSSTNLSDVIALTIEVHSCVIEAHEQRVVIVDVQHSVFKLDVLRDLIPRNLDILPILDELCSELGIVNFL